MQEEQGKESLSLVILFISVRGVEKAPIYINIPCFSVYVKSLSEISQYSEVFKDGKRKSIRRFRKSNFDRH